MLTKIAFLRSKDLEGIASEHKNKRPCDPKELKVLWKIV